MASNLISPAVLAVLRAIKNLSISEFVQFADLVGLGECGMAGLARKAADTTDGKPCVVRLTRKFGDGVRAIQAIKHIRELTGLGLKESKDLVDGVTTLDLNTFHIKFSPFSDAMDGFGFWVDPV